MTMPAIAPPLRPVAAATAGTTTGAADGLAVGLASFTLVGLKDGFTVSPLLVGAAVVGLAVGIDEGWAVGDSVGLLLDGTLVGRDEGLSGEEILLEVKLGRRGNSLFECPSKKRHGSHKRGHSQTYNVEGILDGKEVGC